MEEIVSDISDFCRSLMAKCKEYDGNRRDIEEKYKELSYAYALCTQQIEYMGRQNEEFMSTISRLQKQIEAVEDDKRQLTKVSNIIAIERENSRLKFEMESLKKKLATKLAAPVLTKDTVIEVTEAKEVVMINDDKVAVEKCEEEADTDHEEDLEVYEKKIKNNVYYVSTRDDASVYEKDDDGAIGQKIGYLQKVNGKLKLKMLEVSSDT